MTGGTNTLYFTAGINDEANGLFGSITATPEPETMMLIPLGLVAMTLGLRRRRRGAFA